MKYLMPQFAERMSKAYGKEKKYQDCLNKEEMLYEKLKKRLDEEDLQILDDYMHATIETANIGGRVAYAQGMKDYHAIIKALE